MDKTERFLKLLIFSGCVFFACMVIGLITIFFWQEMQQ